MSYWNYYWMLLLASYLLQQPGYSAELELDLLRPRVALRWLELALTRCPDEAELLYLAGVAQHRLGQHEQAIASTAINARSRCCTSTPLRYGSLLPEDGLELGHDEQRWAELGARHLASVLPALLKGGDLTATEVLPRVTGRHALHGIRSDATYETCSATSRSRICTWST